MAGKVPWASPCVYGPPRRERRHAGLPCRCGHGIRVAPPATPLSMARDLRTARQGLSGKSTLRVGVDWTTVRIAASAPVHGEYLIEKSGHGSEAAKGANARASHKGRSDPRYIHGTNPARQKGRQGQVSLRRLRFDQSVRLARGSRQTRILHVVGQVKATRRSPTSPMQMAAGKEGSRAPKYLRLRRSAST
jgi:hypothetical protein